MCYGIRNSALAIFVSASALAFSPAHAGEAEAAKAPPGSSEAREAGARYGQALGVLEICYGSKITAKGEALPQQFSGDTGELFKAQAAKVYDAWVKVKGCSNQFDPNQCKIIMDKSCLDAEKEIGSNGSAIPGLVEFQPHS
jgi:hypothetical protein